MSVSETYLRPPATGAAEPAADTHAMVASKTVKRTVGLLALQGDFAMHRQAITGLGHEAREVRTAEELAQVGSLIMPGGESTTMRKLIDAVGLMPALKEFAETHPVMGTCAGLILLSRGIESRPTEPTMGLIDCEVARNAYGRQYFSFREQGMITLSQNGSEPFEMVFIRAPRITRIGDGVDILGRLGDEPTIIRQGNILAMTFHPELSGDDRIHAYFLSQM